jgi:hypothetical protein
MEGISMRLWMIVSAGAIGAIAAAAGIAWPTLTATAHADLLPALVPQLPVLATAFLGVYGLCAVALTTGGLVGAGLRLRRRLGRAALQRVANPLDWIAAFEAAGLNLLAPQPAVVQPRAARIGGRMLWQAPFDPRAARAEVARLLHLRLARAHFYSVLIVIAAIIALGLAQDRGPVPHAVGPVPTVPAALILIGLLLLAALGRLAVDVAFDPLIEALARLPADPADSGLLRRIVELLEAARGSAPAAGGDPPAAPVELPERLATVLEEGHRTLVEAIGHMSSTADALGATTRSSVEALEAALRKVPQPAAENDDAGVLRLGELQSAVETLTATLERLLASAAARTGPQDAEPATGRRSAEPQLARELQKLLQEIGSDR